MDPQTQPPIINQPQTPQSPPIPPRQSSKLPLIIGGLVLIILIGGVNYYFGKQSGNNESKAVQTISPTEEVSSPTKTATVNTCVRVGCNKELCVDQSEKNTSSICVFLRKYECYKNAACEKQNNGQCGWTQTGELKQCLGKFENTAEGKYCGGKAGNLPEFQCPKGYKCKLDDSYPDASGKCVKE